MPRRFFRFVFSPTFIFIFFLACFALQTHAQNSVPSPQSILGFTPTTDKTIADWSQITGYFAKLDAASNRVKVEEIGKTTLGKPLIVAFISASENIKNLEKYKQINQKLADPRSVKNPGELANLIKQGKTIVSISCSIHSTEIVASQMSLNLAFELATANDDATKEILQNTILLLIPSSNPDGIDIVADWYRKTLGTKFEGSSPPELYHHYAGHDDNRDWFMLNLRETQAITKFFWQGWFPEIVYDVHQQGQTSSRFIIPPFFDPPNPRVSPLILREVGLIGYKMAADLQAQNVSGVATNSTYDTWWHGGFRSAPYFHNSIGILSEAASAKLMSPVTISEDDLRKSRGVRGLNSPLETATNYPDAWRGGEWTPRDIARIEMIASRALLEMAAKFRSRYLENFYALGKANLEKKADEPKAFVFSANSRNAETVVRFAEILLAQGIEIYQTTRPITAVSEAENPNVKAATVVTGKLSGIPPIVPDNLSDIAPNSFVVYTNQPQRNNILSLFERQIYPQRLNANGEAEVPYDVAGWTLPLQMGVDYVGVQQLLEPIEDSFRRIASINDTRAVLNLKPNAEAFAKLPNPLKTNPKIGLYKSFTASMDEGWTRLVFDTFQIPFSSVSDVDFRNNNLNFDAIVLPSQSEKDIVEGLKKENYPEEFTGGIGEAGVENLKKFVERGGKLICFDDGCELVIKQFNLPVKDVLSGLKRSEFYNPGSVVKLNVDTANPLAKNMRRDTAAYFINSAAYEITDKTKVKSAAAYAEKDSLLSGWTLGEKYMNGKTALAETDYGAGKIILFAFRPQHRGQTFGTFPFIFNALEK